MAGITKAVLVHPIQGQSLFNGLTVLLLEQREFGQVNVRLQRQGRSEASNFSVAQFVKALRNLGYTEQVLEGLYGDKGDKK